MKSKAIVDDLITDVMTILIAYFDIDATCIGQTSSTQRHRGSLWSREASPKQRVIVPELERSVSAASGGPEAGAARVTYRRW